MGPIGLQIAATVEKLRRYGDDGPIQVVLSSAMFERLRQEVEPHLLYDADVQLPPDEMLFAGAHIYSRD